MSCDFYLLKNRKTVNNSTTMKAGNNRFGIINSAEVAVSFAATFANVNEPLLMHRLNKLGCFVRLVFSDKFTTMFVER